MAANLRKIPKSFSPSAASAYAQCPTKWKTIYVVGVKGVPTLEALIGTLSHSILELSMLRPAPERTLDNAFVDARRVWMAFTKTKEFATWETVKPDWLPVRRLIWAAVTQLWELEDPTELDIIATEVKEKVKVGTVPFFGVIDRVARDHGKLRISDYKTGKVVTDGWYDEEPKRQVLLYAAAWEAKTGELADSADLIYLKGKGNILEAHPNRDTVDEAVEWLTDKWEGLHADLKTGEFERTPGNLCGWCPGLETCGPGLDAVADRSKSGLNNGPGEQVLQIVRKSQELSQTSA